MRPHHNHCTTPQVDLVKDESAEGQKWAAAGKYERSSPASVSRLEKKKDGQLIFSLELYGEAGPELKPFRMQRA